MEPTINEAIEVFERILDLGTRQAFLHEEERLSLKNAIATIKGHSIDDIVHIMSSNIDMIACKKLIKGSDYYISSDCSWHLPPTVKLCNECVTNHLPDTGDYES